MCTQYRMCHIELVRVVEMTWLPSAYVVLLYFLSLNGMQFFYGL